MGQRLNIEIVRGDRCLANSYYHWSAYTESAIELVNIILETYSEIGRLNVASMGDLLLAIKLLEATGSGVNETERELINGIDRYKGLTINRAVDRNRGLLSITRKGQEDTRRWEEGRVTIDLSDETIDFDVMWRQEAEDYDDGAMEYDLEYRAEDLPLVNFDFYSIRFDDFHMLGDLVRNNPDGVRISDGDEYVVSWIA